MTIAATKNTAVMVLMMKFFIFVAVANYSLFTFFFFRLQLLGAFLGHTLGIGTHLGFHQLLGTAYPGTLAENLLHILGEDDLAVDEQLCQLGVTLFVLRQDLLGTLVLLVDHP